MRQSIKLFFLIVFAFSLASLPCRAEVTTEGPQSTIKKDAPQQVKYPRIVLYSVSWCPHCMEVKEYLTSHKIPFINRDVEIDNDARTALVEKYKSESVPVLVLGNDEKIIKGFKKENFEKVLKEMSK